MTTWLVPTGIPVGTSRSGRIRVAGVWLSNSWSKGERGGQGSRTASITVVEPVLVPMSQAERAAAVSAFTEIVAGWWAKHADDERTGVHLPQPLE